MFLALTYTLFHCTAVGCALAVWYGYRQLDGMSGDVSGFALTVGELWGVLALAVWR